MTLMHGIFRYGIVAAICLTGSGLFAETWRFEIEDAPLTDDDTRWQITQHDEAGNGALLEGGAGSLTETPGIPVVFPQQGIWHVWVRYQRGDEGRLGSFYTLVRDEDGEGIAFARMDWEPRLPTSRPYEPARAAHHENTSPGDFLWETMTVAIERPMRGTLCFGELRSWRLGAAPRRLDCVIISASPDFQPAPDAWRQVPPQPADIALDAAKPPRGLMPAAGFPMHASFFAGYEEPERQFFMGLSYNASIYQDSARFLLSGFNRTHGLRGDASHGIYMMRGLTSYGGLSQEEAKKYPSPEGRFVNADGQVGRSWSLSFPPVREGLRARIETRIKEYVENPDVDSWSMVAESGGWMDYSEYSVAAFREWLAQRHESIENLNDLWGADYNVFDDVIPAKNVEEHKANWFAFREFNGETFVNAIAEQVPIIHELDPLRRPISAQLSNLDLLAARFTAMRPLDWEQMISVAMKDTGHIGWDAYCADDYMGCEVDLLYSLSNGHVIQNEEWNTHGVDWRVTARTFWTMVGKGVRGVHCFQWQEGVHHDSYPKWALLSHDFTPKQKFGALADAAHEVHRLERLIMSGRRVEPVKPVALYYSRLDLSLAKPLLSSWGEQPNSPYHIYRTLRALGYPVRWITPNQIVAGELDTVGAVILFDALHIPAAAAATLAEWVRKGGAVIADQWPGALDEYGRPQEILTPIFGVRAVAPKVVSDGELALQESPQGYGEITISAIAGDDLPSTVGEIWQQFDASHPVALDLGNYMLSGYGRTRAECFAGEVVGMTFGGGPGVVVHDVEQGYAMWVGMMLGSIYEGSATRFEWDTTHSGMSFHRLLDAFLRHAGLEPGFRVGLPDRQRAKLRVESPLIDDAGNAMIALTSLNDHVLDEFPLSLRWPDAASPPRLLLYAPGGNRRLGKLDFVFNNGILETGVPGMDSRGAILALTDSDPLVGLDITGVSRGPAGLLDVRPGDSLELTVTVHNPSDAELPAGIIQLWAPRGWFISKEKQKCRPIPRWGSRSVRFQVVAPEKGGDTRLRPLTIKYTADNMVSTPATEVVWWNRKGLKQ